MQPAQRIAQLPPYLFLELDRMEQRLRAQGHDVISLGIGDPDLPTPPHVVAALKTAADDPRTHRYPDYAGQPEFRQAVATYYARRFGVTLDPDRQVVGLIGSKEGLAHLTWAWVNPGDTVLVPDPAYPVYRTQAILAGGHPYALPLAAERGFLPDLDAVPEHVWQAARLLWLNYPNNPTGAVADVAFLQAAVERCRRYQVLLAYDAAYVDLGFDGYRAPSILQIPGAEEVAIEFFSLSKPFNMTGWRIAAAVGHPQAVRALAVIKSHIDSGPSAFIQRAAITALGPESDAAAAANVAVYQRRRDLALQELAAMGLAVDPPQATFYLWIPTPAGMTSAETTAFFLERAHVVVTPGGAYGSHGEGWFRISLSTPTDRLEEALARMRRALADR